MIEITFTGVFLCCVAILCLLIKVMLRLFLSNLFDYDCDITGMDQFIFIIVLFLSCVPFLNFFIAYKIFTYTLRMKIITKRLLKKHSKRNAY